ncbi:MAG: portal protein [Alphaproteobacteria bacterium]
MHNNHKTNVQTILNDYKKAQGKYNEWVELWRECYNFAGTNISRKNKIQIFDGTAPDAIDELSGVLMNELYPYGNDWIDIKNKQTKQSDDTDTSINVKNTIMDSIRSSNFQIEIHQCVMDLIIAGTGVMLIEQGDINSGNKLKFTALDLQNIVLQETANGKIDTLYRKKEYSYNELVNRFPIAKSKVKYSEDKTFKIVEQIKLNNGKWDYTVILLDETSQSEIIMQSQYDTPPFIAFRWQKNTGEVYGRSPIMKALPDIKTVNKIAELTLKNASISVTGIWQADDDGVLNPNNIRLVPGAIIPKAVGSNGLQPLKSPGEFNLSNMLIEPLQNRIRKSLLSDVFTTTVAKTATEIQEQQLRSRQVINSVFERITQEAMLPMVQRITDILAKQGAIIKPKDSGLYVDVISPVERYSKMQKVLMVKQTISEINKLGFDAFNIFDLNKTLKWVVAEMDVPNHILIENEPLQEMELLNEQ